MKMHKDNENVNILVDNASHVVCISVLAVASTLVVCVCVCVCFSWMIFSRLFV